MRAVRSAASTARRRDVDDDPAVRAPIAFPARIAAGGVPLWEILLGVTITTAAVVAVVRTAARIYAGALLAQGGRIGLRRAWRAAGELAGR